MSEETNEVQKTALKKLREPFEDNLVNHRPVPLGDKTEYKALPKAQCKICGGYHATSRTNHLSYVGHAALTHRLLEVDPMWDWQPLAFDDKGLPQFDAQGGLWIKLTIAGMTRLGYGQSEPKPYAEIGAREKEIIGDAIRNAGMRFGAALEFWHKGSLIEPDPVVGSQTEGKKDAIKMPTSTKETVVVEVGKPQTEPASTPQNSTASEPLAEAGEIAFISKKLSALKQTDPDALMVEVGVPNLDNLTKANFEKLKNALKGKK